MRFSVFWRLRITMNCLVKFFLFVRTSSAGNPSDINTLVACVCPLCLRRKRRKGLPKVVSRARCAVRILFVCGLPQPYILLIMRQCRCTCPCEHSRLLEASASRRATFQLPCGHILLSRAVNVNPKQLRVQLWSRGKTPKSRRLRRKAYILHLRRDELV